MALTDKQVDAVFESYLRYCADEMLKASIRRAREWRAARDHFEGLSNHHRLESDRYRKEAADYREKIRLCYNQIARLRETIRRVLHGDT